MHRMKLKVARVTRVIRDIRVIGDIRVITFSA